MASSLVTFESVSLACFHIRPIFSLPSNPFVVSTFSSPKTANYIKLKHLPRASSSSEGLPTELIEDSKFVPLTAEDPQYGPPALLLLGFKVEEAAKIQQLLKGMDGEFLEVIFCTEDMITRSLWEAVNTKQPTLDTVKIASSVPRICFLSGLTGEEMMMFVDAFPEIGLEPAVFAALVPNSADKPLQELIEEIMGDHEMLVAVKRVAHDSRQGLREFVAEIATIGRLRHPNLVRLLGYCRRKQELLLVYDYMPNGSLDRFLYGQLKGTLNWMQRFKIIKDVASGLLYLHQQWVQVIIHRDIKASNVLIDNKFNGRLGDFGLAKLCDHGTDPQTTHVAGTLGYIAPELARNGKASTSTDLFAFGAFMLEVVCGRRPVDQRASPEEVILVDWVIDCLERGNILEAIDRQLGTEYAVEEAELVLKLGLLCSHAIAAARPSMSTVVQYLEGRAQLPDNLGDIMRSRDFGNEQDVQLPTSVTSLTISEPFTSTGY